MTTSEMLSLIELTLVYGVLLALLFWQLWDVTRAQKKSKQRKAEDAAASAETTKTE